jgi:hypothetical protein
MELQSPKSASQVMPQVLLMQDGLAFVASGQTIPQVPQLEGSDTTSVQEVPQIMLGAEHVSTQSRAPGLPPQTGIEVIVQSFPQEPQLATSESDCSQPLVSSASQSPKPTSQLIPHIPMAQRVDAFAGAAPQSLPHPPQFSVPLAMFVSHPVESSESQSSKPASQLIRLQVPVAQLSTALGREQVAPQAPQFIRVVSEVSHPFVMSVSQSSQSASQAMPQAPSVQMPEAWPPAGHVMSHIPQLLGSVIRLTQAVPHSVVPDAQLETQE